MVDIFITSGHFECASMATKNILPSNAPQNQGGSVVMAAGARPMDGAVPLVGITLRQDIGCMTLPISRRLDPGARPSHVAACQGLHSRDSRVNMVEILQHTMTQYIGYNNAHTPPPPQSRPSSSTVNSSQSYKRLTSASMRTYKFR